MSGSPPATAFAASLCLLLVLGLLALVIACSSADEEQGSAVPFMVCQSSETWMRPSEEEQARQVWQGPFGFRYSNWDPTELRSTFYEDFFPWHGGNSELFDSWPLHGLWIAKDLSRGDPACAGGGRVGWDVISVYLLLHEAKEVRLSGNTYRITVEATPTGFQQIQFPNLLFPAHPTPTGEYTVMKEDAAEPDPVAKEQPTDYNLLIVDTSGRELARADRGLRFERPTEGSAVPQATEAAAAAGAGP